MAGPVLALVLAAAGSPAGAAELTAAQRVQLVQSALAIVGYPPGPIDGIAGPATEAALAAAARDFGWPDTGGGLAGPALESLMELAEAELTHRLSIELDGRWVLDPAAWDEATARELGVRYPVQLDQACAADSVLAFSIEGLVFTQIGRSQVLVLEYGRVVPVPAGGRPPQSEAHGFVPVGPDVLESLTEGDPARWQRCPALVISSAHDGPAIDGVASRT